jgi:predicted nuclease of predicted toxin-antitoxin system
MLRLLIDENLDQRILRGLQLRVPGLMYAVVQETGLAEASDPALLEWAAQNQYVLVTHDRGMMLKRRAPENALRTENCRFGHRQERDTFGKSH